MQRYIVIDLETTGNSPKKGDRIIQFAGVVIENDRIIDEFSTFLRPDLEIPVFIEELTGITESMVEDAPTFEEVAPKIVDMLRDSCFVAHNVLFDLSFLQEELKRCGYHGFYGSTIDTVELSKLLLPTSDSYKLSYLAKQEGVTHWRPHRADSDAYVTAVLFINLKKKLISLPLLTLKHMYRLSLSLKSEVAELIKESIEIRKKSSPIHNPNIEIFRGLALNQSNEIPSVNEGDVQEYPASTEEKLEMLSKAFLHPEHRAGQLKMMDIVYDALKNGTHAIIEAGTGIGKSLGYLLPAAYVSKSTGTPIMIGTNTLQLQEQLLEKELPKLKTILPFPILAVLIKGRANYLSLAKFERSLREKEDNYETALTKIQILVWLTETATGDRDELNLTSGGQLFWERLQSEETIYKGLQEPWMERDFFERAKKKASKADIIVTNHSFLLADFRSENPFFSRVTNLVLDEAHHFERAASRYLGERLDYITVKTMLNRIGMHDQKQLLYRLEKMVQEHGISYTQPYTAIEREMNDFSYEFEQLFYTLARLAERNAAVTGFNRTSIRIHHSRENQGSLKPAQLLAERLIHYLGEIDKKIRARTVLLQAKQDQLKKNQLFFLNEIDSMLTGILQVKSMLHEFFLNPSEEAVYFLETSKSVTHASISLYSQPIDAVKKLWKEYFSRYDSVVMTSATLSVKGSFRFFMDQLGVPDHKDIQKAVFPSAFDYRKNVKALIAKDMPDINRVTSDEYTNALASHIITAASASKGRMLVLFTSNEMLRSTYEKVKESGKIEEYSLFAQGVSSGSRSRLIRNFQNFEKAVLFGTASFWDGVDIPGEALSCLAIARLPFSPPDEPITEARSNKIRLEGKNPFSVYALPEALLRFRQGFGRLIRTKDDKGILLVLDRRIISAKYGEEFRRAIPALEWEEADLSGLETEIVDWL
ncbi:ATP-dependent DNA helicase DinG [Peribacillus saganii]|uniref:ATP-dependent DNA helicase DinG n=1 Tax=Peribacillus saganii TaxID=2303992 RepID=UPI001314CF59|nr:ATP-dependent DNA helicase DinG [Peribacillus saganii]